MLCLLRRDDDIGDEYVILPCPIRNAFHATSGGCFLAMKKNDINDNGNVQYHVYRDINLSCDRDGRALFEILDFGCNYSYWRYFNSSNCMLFTKLETTTTTCAPIDTTTIARSGELLKGFFKIQNEFYERVIKPVLGTDIHMHPCALYDVVLSGMNYQIITFLRPVLLISDERRFRIAQRSAFINLLNLYANSNECDQIAKQHWRMIRDRRLCSPLTFTCERNVPKELKCEYGSLGACKHIAKHTDMAHTTLATRPEHLCIHLLRNMIDDHGETTVASLLRFECHLRERPESRHSAFFAFIALYGRVRNVHRLCLPDYMLSSSWYEWLQSITGINK